MALARLWERVRRDRVTLWACGLGLALFAGYAPWFTTQVGPIIDFHLGLSWPQDTLMLIHDYGSRGRRAYLGLLALEQAFAWTFAVWLHRAHLQLRAAAALGRPIFAYKLLWFALPMLDLVENAARVVIVVRLPRMATRAAYVSWATMWLKVPLLGLVALVFAYLGGVWLFVRLKGRGAQGGGPPAVRM